MLTYTLTIIDKKKETQDTVTIVFKQPGLKKIKYKAGQYCTLIFRINGRRYLRPYSFSSTPIIDSNLAVTVKRVPGGIVSNHIVDVLNVGDVVEVMEPMGDFLLDDSGIHSKTALFFWGVGSGITPLFSLIKYALKNSPSDVYLIYGNRNEESIIFKEQLELLENEMSQRFHLIHFHTQPQINKQYTQILQGRINPEYVINFLAEKKGIMEDSVHYICGPTGLKESIKSSLNKFNVPSEKIYSEDFEVVKNPEDFHDISTRHVKLIKDQQTTNVEIIKGKSILEAALDAGIELDYSCQTGNCMVCKGNIMQGHIKTIGSIMHPSELKKGEHLLCCSYPLTDDIVIEIN